MTSGGTATPLPDFAIANVSTSPAASADALSVNESGTHAVQLPEPPVILVVIVASVVDAPARRRAMVIVA